MAGAKEIRTQIKSIQNTQKITKAMEMQASRPYAEKMRNVIGHLANAHPEYRHPFLVERSEVKRVGFIIVSTDRGLCGGLNVNLFRIAVRTMKEWSDKGVEVDYTVVGNKALGFFKRLGGSIVSQAGRTDRHRKGDARRLPGGADRPAVPGA